MKVLEKLRSALIQNPGNIWVDTYLWFVLASSILGFLSLRGWTNITLFLLLVPALACFRRALAAARAEQTQGALVAVAIAMAMPFLVLLVSQALRQDLIVKAYDGPLRMLIAIPILYYLYYKRVDFARLLGVVAPLALFILVAQVNLDPKALAHWGGRFATYFVDTDMFGVYALVLAAFCLFSIDNVIRSSGKFLLVLQIAGFAAGMYLVVGSNTRASWLALPFVLLLWPLLRTSRLERQTSITLASLVIVGLGLAFTLYPGAAERLYSGYQEVAQWFDGSNRNTSAGLRLTMWHMSWELFKHSPWVGYGDLGFRAYLSEPWITAIASPEARGIIFVGPHNEFLANLLRSGVLGGLSVLCLFFAPLTVFWQQRRHPDSQVAKACHLGLAYLVGLMVCSISFEVFTLKYTASFYGLIIAGLAAQAIHGRKTYSGVSNVRN
jgi:O-antigen ligase